MFHPPQAKRPERGRETEHVAVKQEEVSTRTRNAALVVLPLCTVPAIDMCVLDGHVSS